MKLIAFLTLVPFLVFAQDDHDPYDVSWATHSTELTHNQALYDGFMEKCIASASNPQICAASEQDRMNRNRMQPASMVNFTENGFKVVKTPPELFAKLQQFWQDHRENDQQPEWKQVIHSYQNAWDAPTTMIPIQDHDEGLRREIWDSAEDILQQWTGQRLAPSAFWGIRVYHNDSILATHVDFTPRVISVIINVDQDVEEDWPLEVWGHDGKVYNVTLKPGDMALYESHSVIHGRPYPFRGKYFANVFVHFEPLGPADKQLEDFLTEPVGDLPPYLNPESAEMMGTWRRHNPYGWNLYHRDVPSLIKNGDLRAIEDLVIQKPSLFKMRTAEGLLAIELALEADQKEIVALLMKMKAYDETFAAKMQGELGTDKQTNDEL
jgi:prolyl 4-hydroxylase